MISKSMKKTSVKSAMKEHKDREKFNDHNVTITKPDAGRIKNRRDSWANTPSQMREGKEGPKKHGSTKKRAVGVHKY